MGRAKGSLRRHVARFLLAAGAVLASDADRSCCRPRAPRAAPRLLQQRHRPLHSIWSLSWRGDLSGGGWGAKEARRGREQGAKNRKGGALGPRLPVRCRASRPFGTISPATARPFGLWITRSASWFPMTRRRDPTTVLVLRRVATTWLPPWPGRNQLAAGFAAQSTPATPPHGIAAMPPDRGTLRLLTPPP